jgi:hydrophobic/amphiphilic exporter-1 (mainly G- bacteria), HAE1 family
MQLTRLAVYRPVVALTVTLALVLFGVVSYFSLGLQDSPEVKLPIVTVTAVYPGASAETVEEQVTRRVEDAIASLGNIKRITSTSQTGVATIVVEFNEGVNADIVATDVQQKVSGIRRDLPPEVEEPSYAKLDFNDTPVVNLAVTTNGYPEPTRLYRLADDLVRPRLETVSGVGRVEVVGAEEPEVLVEVLPDRLQAHGLTLEDVTTAVRAQFLSASGGQLKSGGNTPTHAAAIRVDSRSTDVAALAALPVSARDGFSTELRNVATVRLGGKESEQILRVNGQPAAGLLVYKQSSANITQTVDALRPRLAQINGELPAGYQLELVIDHSVYVRDTVADVQHELVLAAIITGLVLFFFLHSLRSTVIVLLSIPTSLLVALIVMKATGLTLNGMTLIGLTTAIGVLVDDSIVVLENIFSHLERGKGPKRAAVDGRSEIGMAAIAITLVDVAVWGPIVFISGVTGAFLRNFALVMVAATLASLLVSFTLTPLVASRWLSASGHGSGSRSWLTRLTRFWEPAYQRAENGYRHVLDWSLHHRPLVLLVAALVFASNFVLVRALGSEFVPEGNREIVTLVGEMPAGTALEATDRAARRWELALLDHELFPEVHTAYVQVGTNRDATQIRVDLEIGKPKTRERTSLEIGRAAVAAGQAMVPDLRARRALDDGASAQPVQVRVFGDDLDLLARAAAAAETSVARLPMVTDVTNNLTVAREITIRPDPTRLQDLGLSTQTIGAAARVAYQGVEVGRWAEPGGKERDVRVQLAPAARNQPGTVGDLPLARRGDQLVTLRQVAEQTSELKPTKITRVDRQRAATIGADPNGVPLGEATAAVSRALQAQAWEPGTRWEIAGTSEEQQRSFAQLGMGLGLSILLMYLVLAVLYENWLQPVLILTALPLALVGALLGLLVFQQTLSVPSFIGIIALFGLVGKNAILLVDRANDLRRQGLDRTAALEQAGPSRLRPILMTSAVLVLSMLPVALKLGDTGEVRAPLGAVLVGGMTTSTFLSLLYVPVAYTYFDSLGVLLGRLFRWRPRLPRRLGNDGGTPALPAPSSGSGVACVACPLPMAGGAPTRRERAQALRRHRSLRAPRGAPSEL